MTDEFGTVSLYDLGVILSSQDPYPHYEPQFGELGYDYGYAEDGFPVPPPCIIDGTPFNACRGTDPEANSI